ncbi:hypothetical protein DITRI_Ditri09bG0007900 [Diplodiscus trichospermus]
MAAAALVSSILQQLTAITIKNARQELKLVTDVEKELGKLESNFKAIHCVLEDAEEKQIVQKSVKLWLERLKEVSYGMEDVLDEWETAIIKLNIDGAEKVYVRRKVRSCFSCFASCRQIVRRHDIAAKIKEINEDLDVIAKEKIMYQLARSSEIKQPIRLESTSFVDVSRLHGRDEVKNQIVSTLLGGNAIQTISIVGMGGIGKTAIAQLIYNDNEVLAHFNHIIWVCVSDIFDPNKIARAILRGLYRDSTNSFQNLISLQDVLTQICEKIRSAKFLLVLDDVWTDHEQDWEPLMAAFQQGMPGSRILITTRKESVATGMGSSQVFPLKELSDKVCWLILSQLAFIGKDNDLCENLDDIGREIAKKCKGLPLAAKTLGGLLRQKKTKNEWKNVLNSEIWKLNVAQEYIFTPLLLSYYDLPSQIRPCLLYCAIFPKDFDILSVQLIKHWNAHGYLNSYENLGRGEEEKGKEYFNCLASRSFFQGFEKDIHGNISVCKMHDIVHDFVQSLTNEEIVEVEVDSSDLCSKKARHLRVTIVKNDQFPTPIHGIEKLRSLVPIGEPCDVTGEALRALFRGAKSLRLLEFGLDWFWNPVKVTEIPNEISKLIHLRYINLSGSDKLKQLPEGVCELHNLQYLHLFCCKCLEKLPDGIGNLMNLRSLYTVGCDNLEQYPKGIGRLQSLRQLTPVRARIEGNDTKEFSVGDLENLDLLRGFLQIRLVGNVVNKEEFKRAKLHNKIHLNQLNIDLKQCGTRDLDAFIQALNAPPSLRIEFN